MCQEVNGCDDNYGKVNTDILFLIDRLRLVKNKVRETPWYRIGTKIKLRKEISDIEKETDKIGERLNKLNMEKKNPIQIVKRQ